MKPTVSTSASKKTTERLEAYDRQVQQDIEKLDPKVRDQVRSLQSKVNQEVEAINNSVFDFETENRLRNQGVTPRQAEELAEKIKHVKVGQIFNLHGQDRVLTPFKTVVSAQHYVSFLQERILDNPQFKKEVELASALKSYTSLSSFGLIKLAIKQLFRSKKNG